MVKEKKIADDLGRQSGKDTVRLNETYKSKTIRKIKYSGYALIAITCVLFVILVLRDMQRNTHISQVVKSIDESLAKDDYAEILNILSKEPIYVNENAKIRRIKETAREKHLEKIEQIKKENIAEVIALLRQEKGEKSENLLEVLNNLDPNNKEFSLQLSKYRDDRKMKIRDRQAALATTNTAPPPIKTIDSQFSSWDGSHIQFAKLVKSNMHDPGSFEHVETKYWTMSNHIIVNMKFRGKNTYGALVLNYAKAKCDKEGKLIEIIEILPL